MNPSTTIAAIGALDGAFGLPPAPNAQPSSAVGADFANVFQRELSQVSADVSAAETAMSDYAQGKPVELHDLMIRMERARLSVQVFVQVRNKIVESYQDLMRMQT